MSLKALRRRRVRIANSRWTTYAVAGAATSLAGLVTAEAEIHYSGPVNFQFKGDVYHGFSMGTDASLFFAHGDKYGRAVLKIGRVFSASFAGDRTQTNTCCSTSPFYLYRLASHVNVSQQPLGHSCSIFSATYGSSTFTYCIGGLIGVGLGSGGHFTEPGRGFIGFSFRTLTGKQYGWVRVKTTGAGENNFIVLDYAWGDVGEPIATGQKRSLVHKQAVTKTGSLGLLATGATGLKAWRQQRGAGTH